MLFWLGNTDLLQYFFFFSHAVFLIGFQLSCEKSINPFSAKPIFGGKKKKKKKGNFVSTFIFFFFFFFFLSQLLELFQRTKKKKRKIKIKLDMRYLVPNR